MAIVPIPNYIESVWSVVKSSLAYAQSNITPADVTASAVVAIGVQRTLRNALTAIDTYLLFTAMQQNYATLAAADALPITLDQSVQGYIASFITALQSSSIATQSLLVPIPTTASIGALLSQGKPALSDPGLIEWMMQFAYTSLPIGVALSDPLGTESGTGVIALESSLAALGTEITTPFFAGVAGFAQAWQTFETALKTQGVAYTGSQINVIEATSRAAIAAATELSELPVSSVTNLEAVWNVGLILPTISRLAAQIYNDPTNEASQQISSLRNVILSAFEVFNTLNVSYRTALPDLIRTTTVRRGDTLMDIAARELGDYSQWYSIAQVNNLQPPFLTSASVGSVLFLPTSGTPLGVQSNYDINFLGVDLYLGPLGQNMTSWTGDFNLVSGYNNLAISLDRRILTTIGTLIYHSQFGSRIPPEVGQITDLRTAGYLKAYATSALLSDPRVDQVTDVTVNGNAFGLFGIVATVVPQGQGLQSVTVNSVLQPALR